MYRRPKFLEILLEIRREMAHEADYDVYLFAEIVRSGSHAERVKIPAEPEMNGDTADSPAPLMALRARKR